MTSRTRPNPDEIGHGLKYDTCIAVLCDGIGHRVSIDDGYALYRCEQCGEEWDWPVGFTCETVELFTWANPVVPVATRTVCRGTDPLAFDEAATIAAWIDGTP